MVEQELARDQEHRWNRVWTFVPYGLLVPASCWALWNGQSAAQRGWIVAVTLALAVWHAWWILRHPHWWERAVGPMLGYFAGVLILLSAALIHSDVFMLSVIGWYPMAFVALPGRWSYFAVAALSLLGVDGWPSRDWPAALTAGGWVFPVGGALVGLIGFLIRRVEQESIRRRHANTELAELARQNAALQGQLVEHARHAAVTDERARLARELHDTVAQGLAAIVTQLDTAEESAAQESQRRLRIARDLARDGLAEVRRAVQAWRPAQLEQAALSEAIAELVAIWRVRHDTAAVFTMTGQLRPMPAEVDATLLRAAQEALTNVARHAAATRVDVTLSYMEDMVVLAVRDNGRGWRSGHGHSGGGFGLEAMRDRVARLRGAVAIESSPTTGSALSASIPVSGGDAA